MDLQFAHSDLVVAVLSSLLDVLVVAYLIYRVLLLIRGTRAQQILMGLGVIAFAFFASRSQFFSFFHVVAPGVPRVLCLCLHNLSSLQFTCQRSDFESHSPCF